MWAATARNVIGGPPISAILAPRECILGSRHWLEFGIGPDPGGDVCKDCIDWETFPGLGVASLLLKVGGIPQENERDPPRRECVSPHRLFARCVCALGLFLVNMVAGDEPLFRSAAVDRIERATRTFDHVLLGSVPVEAPLGSGTIELIADSRRSSATFLSLANKWACPSRRRCSSRPRRVFPGRGRRKRVGLYRAIAVDAAGNRTLDTWATQPARGRSQRRPIRRSSSSLLPIRLGNGRPSNATCTTTCMRCWDGTARRSPNFMPRPGRDLLLGSGTRW